MINIKNLIILTLISLNLNAETYRVKSGKDGNKGIIPIEIIVHEGWKVFHLPRI